MLVCAGTVLQRLTTNIAAGISSGLGLEDRWMAFLVIDDIKPFPDRTFLATWVQKDEPF